MEPNELRRAIAENLGYRFERPSWMGEENCLIFGPEGEQRWNTKGSGKPWSVFHNGDYGDAIPDWPNDLGEAVTLCLRIVLDHFEATGERWQLSLSCVGPIYFGAMYVYDNVVQEPGLFRANTPALAASMLALHALKPVAAPTPPADETAG